MNRTAELSDPARWRKGELAILSNFGWRDISVVEVIDWEDVVPFGQGKFENVDENTIRTTRGQLDSSWNREDGYVPCRTLKTYGETGGRTTYADGPGKVHIVIPDNLYTLTS